VKMDATEVAWRQTFEAVAASRRSVYFFASTPVPRDVIEWAIRMATLAPNHYKTRPWGFHVFDGEGREALAAAFEQGAASLGQDPRKARSKVYPAPTTIVVTSVSDPAHPKAMPFEDQLATAAAIENLLLAFSSAGVGTIWGTGRLIQTDSVRALVGMRSPEERILAAITVGYPDPERPLPERPEEDPSLVTRWHG